MTECSVSYREEVAEEILAATFATLGATVGAGFAVVWPASAVAAVAGVAFVVVVGYGLARMDAPKEDNTEDV